MTTFARESTSRPSYSGEDPYLFFDDEETRKKLVKDEAEVVPPGRIRGIPKHVFEQQSKKSFITGDHIQLLISLMKRNAEHDSEVALGVHIVPLATLWSPLKK